MASSLSHRLWTRSSDCHHLAMLISSLARAKSYELVALLPMVVGSFLRPDMLIVDARFEVEGDLLRREFIRFVIESHTLMTSFPSNLANARRRRRQRRTL
eukprot:8427055-Karenia_brevis.AAC.1